MYINEQHMKLLFKYYSLILTVILFVCVIIEYIDLKQLISQTEKDSLIVDFAFNGWIVLCSFTIITIFELVLKKSFYKLLIRIFLTITLIGLLLSHQIPIDEFDSGVENTVVFSGFIAIILFLALGLKKLHLRLFKQKTKMPAATKG